MGFTFADLGSTCGAQGIIEIQPGQEDIVLNSRTSFYKDGTLGIGDIQRVIDAPDSDFERNTVQQEVNYGFDHKRGWCKFTIKNLSDDNRWVLRVQQARVDTVQLYVLRQNGALEKYPATGHFQTIAERPVHALNFAHHLLISWGETVTFYVYTQRQHGHHATVLNLQTKSYFQNYEHRFGIAIGFLCGFIALAALAGFVLYCFVPDKVYLYYSIYCISFLVLTLVNTGLVQSEMSIASYQTVINTFTTIFYYWIMGWHILFTIELLGIKSYKQRWVYWVGFVSGWAACLQAAFLLLPFLPDTLRWEIVYVSYYLVIFLDAYILYTCIVSMRRRAMVVYFYLAGFLVTVIVAFILTLADLDWIDGVNQHIDLFYATPLVEIIFMVIGLGIHYSNTIKERFSVQIALNNTQSQIITIQEDERRRIAQDLHDDVSNSLAAIKNMVIQQRDPLDIKQEMDNLIDTVRDISHNLMPVDFHQFSIAYILETTVNKFSDHPQIVIEFDCTGHPVKLRPLTELVIYRIVNELINNILKHAQARSAFIQLIYQKESLVVTVEDSGIGLQRSSNPEGIGLRSIRLRAEYIHAQLSMESDNRGTLVILEIPYESNRE